MTSSTAKRGVLPIAKPVKPEKAPSRLSRKAPMGRKPGKLKRGPLGHCTDAQKARVAEHCCIVCGKHFDRCEPAHVVPRGHPKMTDVAANDTRAVVPLCHEDHLSFDEGMDLLPFLEPDWRDAQEWAAGAVGLATALRSISGEPGPLAERSAA